MIYDRGKVLLVARRESTILRVRTEFDSIETGNQPSGYQVVEVPDLPAAMPGIQAGEFQAVLMDIGPGDYFQQPLKDLKKVDTHLPVILLADSFEEGLILQALSVGAQECVSLAEDPPPMIPRAVLRALARQQASTHFRRLAEKERETLRTEEQTRLAAKVYDNTSEGIIITDSNGEIVSVNQAFTEITGYSPEEAIGKTPNLLKSGRHDDDFYARMWASLNDTGQWRGEIWNRRKDGDIYPEWLTISAVKDELGEIINYMAIFIDISQRIQNEELLRYLATHDPLTNIPNRELFKNRLIRALARSHRSHQKVAVLMLDLDEFKSINDRLGHAAGDMVLQKWANRLKSSLRESDTVARLGGDEFSIILEGVTSKEDARTVVEKIILRNEEPYALNGHIAHLTVSIGITLYPDDGQDYERLLHNADQAMYAAKGTGKNNFVFFRRSLEAERIS